MTLRHHFQRRVLAAYKVGLRLYPPEFRDHCAGEMAGCAARMLAESASSAKTILLLADDLVQSLIKEHFAMNKSRMPELAGMLVLTTFIAGTAYLISQQVLRMNANDPQVQMAEDAVSRLAAGDQAAGVIPERAVDMASSLAPFVIVYDKAGQAVASSAQLNGVAPAPPRGVFEAVSEKGEERVTWQPQRGVRIASVVKKTSDGFVLAGRSLREVEVREGIIFKLAGLGWLFANAALMFLWLVTPWFRRSPRMKAAA